MLMYHGEDNNEETSGLGDRVVYDPAGKELIRMRGGRIIYISPGHKLVRMKGPGRSQAIKPSGTVPYAAAPMSGEESMFGLGQATTDWPDAAMNPLSYTDWPDPAMNPLSAYTTDWPDVAMNPLSGHGAQMNYGQMVASQKRRGTPAWWPTPPAGMSDMDWKQMRADRPAWKGLSQSMDYRQMQADRPMWKGLSQAQMTWEQIQADAAEWKGLSAAEKMARKRRGAMPAAPAIPAAPAAPAAAAAMRKRRRMDDDGSMF